MSQNLVFFRESPLDAHFVDFNKSYIDFPMKKKPSVALDSFLYVCFL